MISNPIWDWIEDLRSAEEQRFIDKNIDKINEIFIEYAKSIKYL